MDFDIKLVNDMNLVNINRYTNYNVDTGLELENGLLCLGSQRRRHISKALDSQDCNSHIPPPSTHVAPPMLWRCSSHCKLINITGSLRLPESWFLNFFFSLSPSSSLSLLKFHKNSSDHDQFTHAQRIGGWWPYLFKTLAVRTKITWSLYSNILCVSNVCDVPLQHTCTSHIWIMVCMV